MGTLVASNRPRGAEAFGIGSHCDSNRNGGKWDGTLGVVVALEVARLAADQGLDLPLRVISFLEEEGSGFGQMLLGSRIMLQRVTEEELREHIRTEEGQPFWDAAKAAGYEPERWRESIHELDGLVGWVETHIEQGRVLQDTGNRIGDRRGDRRLRARRPALHGPRRPRRRDADGLPGRRVDPGRRDDRRARAAGQRDRARRRRDGRRGRDEPEPHQRRAGRDARLARPALRHRRAPGAAGAHRRLRARARGRTRRRRGVDRAPAAAGDAARPRHRRRAGGRRRGDRASRSA